MMLHRHLLVATALAAVLAAAPLRADEIKTTQDTLKTNPGFNPDIGQINAGETKAAPSSSIGIRVRRARSSSLTIFPAVASPSGPSGPGTGAHAVAWRFGAAQSACNDSIWAPGSRCEIQCAAHVSAGAVDAARGSAKICARGICGTMRAT